MLIFFRIIVFMVQKLKNFDPRILITVDSFHVIDKEFQEVAHLLFIRYEKVDLSVRQF
jgi:hypothetical protein